MNAMRRWIKPENKIYEWNEQERLSRKQYAMQFLEALEAWDKTPYAKWESIMCRNSYTIDPKQPERDEVLFNMVRAKCFLFCGEYGNWWTNATWARKWL